MNNRISIATIDSPEFVNLQPMDINPLMSKCDVKVLYVGQNRNKSLITKQVATQMSKTLRGCPIVGYYIEQKEDFGDHGNQVIIDGEGIQFKKLTKPYGFVSPDAKVWFQFFEDEDEFGNTCIREYLMTEGYLWTGQFEECERVLYNSNPQSMELDEKTIKGFWSTDDNQGVEFFIINDATFSKLCILGDDVEPCFEGANVSAPSLSSQFSNNNNFTTTLFTMMEELKSVLNNNKGGQEMFLEKDNGTAFEEKQSVMVPVSSFEEDGAASGSESGDTTPADGADTTDTSAADPETPETGTQTDPADPIIPDDTQSGEIEIDESSIGSKKKEEIPTSILQNAKKKDDEEEDEKNKKEEGKEDKSNSDKNETNTEDDGKDKEDDEEKKKKKNFSLEEKLDALQAQFSALQAENEKLLAFKNSVEDKEKDDLIASFYMLSDEDKKDVIANKANYSLKEIKAELSMICVDKKVNFNMSDNEKNDIPAIYNLNAHKVDSVPSWLKGVEEIRNRNNQ